MYNKEWYRDYYKENQEAIIEYQKEYFKKRRAIDPNYQRENRKKYNHEYCKGRFARDIKMRKRLKEAYEEKRRWLNELKNKPCLDCGQTYPPYVMEFDHRDPKTKLFSPGNFGFCSKKEFEVELAKCDLVCANCHRVRTYKQRLAGFFKREGIKKPQIDLSESAQIELRLQA